VVELEDARPVGVDAPAVGAGDAVLGPIARVVGAAGLAGQPLRIHALGLDEHLVRELGERLAHEVARRGGPHVGAEVRGAVDLRVGLGCRTGGRRGRDHRLGPGRLFVDEGHVVSVRG
jgi:hypothetical protein